MDLQITFRHIPPSEAFKTAVEREARQIESVLVSGGVCRVVVEGLPHSHEGKRFALNIELVVHGGSSLRVREEGPSSSRADPYSAVRAAFRRLRQQLDSETGASAERRRRRGKQKTA
ncbi:MAG: HPF/RaiA family ribosome-associated protein [Alphaproteobacteria bacterium]